MTHFTVDCAYCSPTNTLMRAELPEGADELKWRNAWKRTTTGAPGGGPQYSLIECGGCGADFQLIDDGVDADQGGLVERKNISRPKILSVSVSGGVPLGGTPVTITGEALENGSLVVKFGDKVASITSLTSTSADVVTPPGTYTLNLLETAMDRVVVSGVSGTFVADESVTFGSTGATGTLRRLDGNDLYVALSALPGGVTRETLVGEVVTGGTSGATATTVSSAKIDMLIGEEVIGQSSGAHATVKSQFPMLVDNPTGAFGPDELVVGQASGATVKLTGSPAYSGAVDVTVSNEFGQRADGGSLPSGFSYF